jgi:hypothetical protein
MEGILFYYPNLDTHGESHRDGDSKSDPPNFFKNYANELLNAYNSAWIFLWEKYWRLILAVFAVLIAFIFTGSYLYLRVFQPRIRIQQGYMPVGIRPHRD